jgi:hypothetical protein
MKFDLFNLGRIDDMDLCEFLIINIVLMVLLTIFVQWINLVVTSYQLNWILRKKIQLHSSMKIFFEEIQKIKRN